MRIPPLTDLTDILWEGQLEPPEGAKGLESDIRADELPVAATIARPSVWADGQLLGEKWQPPLGGERFHVVRLAFSLRPQARGAVVEASFRLRLDEQPGRIDGPTIYDAYPLQTTVEEARTVTLGLSPGVTIKEVSVELGSVEATFDRTVIIPVITAYDVGTSAVLWRYAARRRYPLDGTRVMLAVVRLPREMPWVAASIELSARTRTGLFPLGVPERAWAPLRFRIPE